MTKQTSSQASNQRDSQTDSQAPKQTQAITPQALTTWCDNYLLSNEFSDYAPNGLQVDAGQAIEHIVTGVTACEALIDIAIEQQAQAILVHHGYFWKGENPCLVGMKGNRIRKLMQHGISLIAYHLPLDAHPIVGNNAQLAQLLELTGSEPLYPEQKHSIGNIYYPKESNLTVSNFKQRIEQTLNRPPLHIPPHITTSSADGERTLNKIAICSGGAQDMIEQAYQMGCDAYISGEISERTTHSARELGIDYFACGHHATERYGIKAFGELIERELGKRSEADYNLSVEFVDVDNPA